MAELSRRTTWKYVEPAPPRDLIARAMEIAVVDPADWDRELVAYSTSECARLGKGEVMRI
jgi:hypothetical protein